jgi:hypothetical protein
MAGFDDPAFFGDRWADVYDERTTLDPAAAVEFLAGLADGGRVLELAIGTGRVALPLAARGIAVEGIEAVTFSGEGVQLHPVALRYCWPSELDLMAAGAGLRLSERYADWDRRPFTSDSGSHVSVYRPAA